VSFEISSLNTALRFSPYQIITVSIPIPITITITIIIKKIILILINKIVLIKNVNDSQSKVFD